MFTARYGPNFRRVRIIAKNFYYLRVRSFVRSFVSPFVRSSVRPFVRSSVLLYGISGLPLDGFFMIFYICVLFENLSKGF